VPSLPVALATVTSALAGVLAATAAATWAAVEVAAEEPLVATLTVIAFPVTLTVSGVLAPVKINP
jgi:heme/copper-type cytochrome/quinol oxidase subunit 2